MFVSCCTNFLVNNFFFLNCSAEKWTQAEENFTYRDSYLPAASEQKCNYFELDYLRPLTDNDTEQCLQKAKLQMLELSTRAHQVGCIFLPTFVTKSNVTRTVTFSRSAGRTMVMSEQPVI